MRTVLYAEDMEPITVIELSWAMQKYLKQQGFVRVDVITPMTLQDMTAGKNIPIDSTIKIVNIYAERLVRGGREHMMLFTGDEESALLLKCAFLPGQNRELQERERDAFAKGFLYALKRVCGE